MAIRFQQKRDTAANWTSNDPILLAGEWGYETDTGKIKIGDGSTAWTVLDYIGGDLIDLIAGTTNEVDVTDDGVGGVVISLSDIVNFGNSI